MFSQKQKIRQLKFLKGFGRDKKRKDLKRESFLKHKKHILKMLKQLNKLNLFCDLKNQLLVKRKPKENRLENKSSPLEAKKNPEELKTKGNTKKKACSQTLKENGQKLDFSSPFQFSAKAYFYSNRT